MLLYSIIFVLLLHSQLILGADTPRPNNTAECEAMDYCHQGQCVMINQVVECNCIKPYVDDIDGIKCNYEGKSKLTAFLLSLFLGGLGADWFYLCSGDGVYIFAGIVKLGLQLFFPLLCVCFSMACGDSVKVVGIGCAIFMPIAAGIWWLADWIRIVANQWDTDGSGHSIFSDM